MKPYYRIEKVKAVQIAQAHECGVAMLWRERESRGWKAVGIDGICYAIPVLIGGYNNPVANPVTSRTT